MSVLARLRRAWAAFWAKPYRGPPDPITPGEIGTQVVFTDYRYLNQGVNEHFPINCPEPETCLGCRDALRLPPHAEALGRKLAEAEDRNMERWLG